MSDKIEIFDFSNSLTAKGVFYGGDAGAKEAIIFNDVTWMIKYPKTTRDLINPQISYTTSPLSEYLGSKIYEILGFPVHEVLIGVRKNKIVVACRDFTKEIRQMLVTKEFAKKNPAYQNKINQLVPIMYSAKELIHFHYLKNNFMANDLDEYSGTGSETFLDEVLATIKGEPTLSSVEGVLERFWDMFVIDAFIGNNDRNNGNWGLLMDNETKIMELAPVYDNGNAFFNKRSLKQMATRLADEEAMKQDAYHTPTCVYKYTGLDNEGHKINPFKFIEDGIDSDCTAAVNRFVQKVDMEKIKSLIDCIPETIGTLAIMPAIQKEFYLELLALKLEKLNCVAKK